MLCNNTAFLLVGRRRGQMMSRYKRKASQTAQYKAPVASLSVQLYPSIRTVQILLHPLCVCVRTCSWILACRYTRRLKMSLSLYTLLMFTVTLCVILQEGIGLPLSGQSETPAKAAPHRVRTKRCSCSNWLDKECIYFCHLDIIWVNTPSKITPYGLGSPLSRRRRSSARCECARPDDETCSGFCRNSSENSSILNVTPLEDTDAHSDVSLKTLLTSFRNVVKANMAAVHLPASSRKKSSRANRAQIK